MDNNIMIVGCEDYVVSLLAQLQSLCHKFSEDLLALKEDANGLANCKTEFMHDFAKITEDIKRGS